MKGPIDNYNFFNTNVFLKLARPSFTCLCPPSWASFIALIIFKLAMLSRYILVIRCTVYMNTVIVHY